MNEVERMNSDDAEFHNNQFLSSGYTRELFLFFLIRDFEKFSEFCSKSGLIFFTHSHSFPGFVF